MINFHSIHFFALLENRFAPSFDSDGGRRWLHLSDGQKNSCIFRG